MDVCVIHVISNMVILMLNRKKMHPNKNKSDLTWAHYYVPCSKEIVDREIGIAGKRHVGPVRRVGYRADSKTDCAKTAVVDSSVSCGVSANSGPSELPNESETASAPPCSSSTDAAQPCCLTPQCL